MADSNSAQFVDKVNEGLTGVFGEASPSTLFSEPIEAGDSLVVTASAWERAGGFGFGFGEGQGEDGETGEGGGGGGGGFSQGRPIAAIRITTDGVDVEPIIDITKIGVTVLISAVGVIGALRASRG